MLCTICGRGGAPWNYCIGNTIPMLLSFNQTFCDFVQLFNPLITFNSLDVGVGLNFEQFR